MVRRAGKPLCSKGVQVQCDTGLSSYHEAPLKPVPYLASGAVPAAACCQYILAVQCRMMAVGSATGFVRVLGWMELPTASNEHYSDIHVSMKANTESSLC